MFRERKWRPKKCQGHSVVKLAVVQIFSTCSFQKATAGDC